MYTAGYSSYTSNVNGSSNRGRTTPLLETPSRPAEKRELDVPQHCARTPSLQARVPTTERIQNHDREGEHQIQQSETPLLSRRYLHEWRIRESARLSGPVAEAPGEER